MSYEKINSVYFIGVGGIGMSAIARYFNSRGLPVAGYDKTKTVLTEQLASEGIPIHYEDWGENACQAFKVEDTLVVYTPAVPKDFGELVAFQEKGYQVVKRAEALGIISAEYETFAVGGTHGKTTTATILAHVLNQTEEGVNAFIGGISSNYDSNCILNPESDRVVVEADEFDRSFLRLSPNHTIITSIDADHLDIYGDGQSLESSFNEFINLTNADGHVMVSSKIDFSKLSFTEGINIHTYGFETSADWVGENIRYEYEKFMFDVPTANMKDVELGIPGAHNAENALAVIGLCMEVGIPEYEIREGLRTFQGVRRRFDVRLKRDDLIIIDDYAHHPTELDAFLGAVKQLYPERQMTVIFQPHLFSRTRDFMDGFAESLSLADELYLLPIYPAREKPIEGITSEVLLDKVMLSDKEMSSLENITFDLSSKERELILIVGAGDIDTIVQPIVKEYGG